MAEPAGGRRQAVNAAGAKPENGRQAGRKRQRTQTTQAENQRDPER